jgi:hypothetical protein
MHHASHSISTLQRPTPLHLVPSPAPRARPAAVRAQHVFAAALLSLVGMGMTVVPELQPQPANSAAIEF